MQVKSSELKKMLSRGPITFIFEKKNGGARQMTATTNPQWTPDNATIEQRSDKAITVYDMEKEAYRSVSADAFIVM
jgi:hypothetical protein